MNDENEWGTHRNRSTKSIKLAWVGRIFSMDSAKFTPKIYKNNQPQPRSSIFKLEKVPLTFTNIF